jgi:hypothetical protein
MVRESDLNSRRRPKYSPVTENMLTWRLSFLLTYPFARKLLPPEDRAPSTVAKKTARTIDRGFGALPVDMELRPDGYWFGALPMVVFGSATVLACFAGLVFVTLSIGPIDDGGTTDSTLRAVIAGLCVPAMYGACLMVQITGYRGALCRRDHARWVKAGRPADWVPSAGSQPRDLDFIYALAPTALAFLLILTST